MGRAETFTELSKIALKILRRMAQPIGQVCGPITSGGLWSEKVNLKALEKEILKLQEKERIIFNQLPFERHLHRIVGLPSYKGGTQLLEDFYFPIFQSGLVKTLYFLPRWATSLGSRWERQQAIKLGLLIVYLEE